MTLMTFMVFKTDYQSDNFNPSLSLSSFSIYLEVTSWKTVM